MIVDLFTFFEPNKQATVTFYISAWWRQRRFKSTHSTQHGFYINDYLLTKRTIAKRFNFVARLFNIIVTSTYSDVYLYLYLAKLEKLLKEH